MVIIHGLGIQNDIEAVYILHGNDEALGFEHCSKLTTGPGKGMKKLGVFHWKICKKSLGFHHPSMRIVRRSEVSKKISGTIPGISRDLAWIQKFNLTAIHCLIIVFPS